MKLDKFKAWLPNEGKMTRPHTLKEIVSICSLGYPDDAVWLKLTGLKDKKGIEIWDGDIIEWEWDSGKKEIEQVMHSLDWDGSVSTSAPFMSAWGSTCGRYYKTFMNIYDPTRYAVVIGNIYENPELIP